MSAHCVTADPVAAATATVETIRPMLVVAARRAGTTIAAVTGAAWLAAYDRVAEILAADPDQVDRVRRQIVAAAVRAAAGPAEPVMRMHRGHAYAVALDDAPAADTAVADDPLGWLTAAEAAEELAAKNTWHALALHDALAGSRPVWPAICGDVASARTLRRRRTVEAIQMRMTGWGWDADMREPAPEAARDRRAAA
jgi:hypothetical protein